MTKQKINIRQKNLDITLEILVNDELTETLGFRFKKPTKLEIMDIYEGAVKGGFDVKSMKVFDNKTQEEISEIITNQDDFDVQETLRLKGVITVTLELMAKKLLKAYDWDGTKEAPLDYLNDLDEEIKDALMAEFMKKAMPLEQKKLIISEDISGTP